MQKAALYREFVAPADGGLLISRLGSFIGQLED